MILINKGQANTVVLTLSERTTITNPTYLFELINDNTNATKYFIAQDSSINKERFNEFTITENQTEDLLNGQVSLAYGDYKYNVYEQSSTTNLDPTQAGWIVEIGRVNVLSATPSAIEFSSATTVIEFNG